jgi:hypothetical protein
MNTTIRPIMSFALAAASAAAFTAAPAFAHIPPADTPAATRQAIQNAIDGAGAGGTVTLGAGLFEIDSQLTVTNGVVLEGQGWDHTIIKQVATTSGEKTRVVEIDGNATVRHVTLTGGSANRPGGWSWGGGALVVNGTISWCCITNNTCGSNVSANNYGGGVGFGSGRGRIDHSIIADNLLNGTQTSYGGGIAIRNPTGPVAVDACLVSGNRIVTTAGPGKGGGIGIEYGTAQAVTVRNTTIVGNASGSGAVPGEGGAVYTTIDSSRKFSMLNCIVAGNTTAHSDTTVELSYPGAVDYCFFDVAGDKLGEHSLVGEPEFVDAANRDYHLGEESLAIRAGTPYEGIGNDLGNAPFHTTPSLGCYEFFGELVVVRPVFSPVTGTTFHPSLRVSLSCAMDDASIYYTMDDATDPDESSTLYTAPISISATTTIRARAYKNGRNPSQIVSATYTRTSKAQPPELEAVSVTPGAMTATVSGEIVSPGNNGATACDVYFAVGKRADRLGTPERIAAGATVSFAHSVTGLVTETTYYYELTVVNNAQSPASTSLRGEFTTTSGVKPVSGDPAATRKTIQDEIDAVAPTHGTVVLGIGLFEIDSQLMVTNGVTLRGQGWDNTIIKQTATVSINNNALATRVATVSGGATIEHLALTGGRVTGGNYQFGGGVLVSDGTISWCCITNNAVYGNSMKYGGGVGFYKGHGQVDHCIVADNVAQTEFGTVVGGGGIGGCEPNGSFLVDTCLVYGNRAVYVDNTKKPHAGHGGGIGFDLNRQNSEVVVRNTTIAGNTAGGEGASEVSEGGGVYTSNDSKNKFSMFNCIVAGNTTVNTNITVKLDYAGDVDHCLFDVAEDKLGEHSKVANPRFVKPERGNYHLSSGSPALGVGTWYEGIVEDLDRARRLKYPAAGCYEVQFCTIMIIR